MPDDVDVKFIAKNVISVREIQHLLEEEWNSLAF